MKLTKTSRQAWINAVLSAEVQSPDFAKMEREAWDEVVVQYMPLAVASIYKSPTHREWINPEMVAKIREQIGRDIATARDKNPKLSKLVACLDQIEDLRDRHQRNVDNIRDALSTAANSVTTVLGLEKLVPQYAEYLPGTKGRPTSSEAQVAIFGLKESLAAVKTPVKPPRLRRKR